MDTSESEANFQKAVKPIVQSKLSKLPTENALMGAVGRDFVAEYCSRAPLSLALERSLECAIYSGRMIQRPILDLGCGDGVFVEVAFGEECRVDYGLEPNLRELNRAKKRRSYSELIGSTGAKIPLPDSSVNSIISNSVLEHIPDLPPVLGEAIRVLKSGGEMHVTLPTKNFETFSFTSNCLRTMKLFALDRSFRKKYNSFWNHYNVHDAFGWKQLFEQNSFIVEEILEYCPNRRAMIHDLLVFFAFPAFLVNKICHRYFLFEKIRHLIVQMLRNFLPKSELEQCSEGTGALIYLKLRKSFSPRI